MNTCQSSIYSHSAYRSDNSNNLPLPRFSSDLDRSGFFDTHLAFGNYAHLEPVTEVTLQLQCDTHHAYEQQAKQGEKPSIYCDSRRWRFQYSSGTPHLIFVAKFMSFSFIWALWGIVFYDSVIRNFFPSRLSHELSIFLAFISAALMITSLVLNFTSHRASHYLQLTGLVICTTTLLWLQGSLWGSTEMHIAYWGGTFLYFMGAIGCDGLLWLYSLYSEHDGSEFNRLDGMVRFKRRFRRLFVAPFEEFDPVLRILPTGFGSHDYTIVLRHRYTDNSLTLATKVHALGLDQVNALAFWDCLQRYMDVTQPLPDLPVLEQTRHLDPVTAEHDIRTSRPARRWRDQALVGWKAGGEKQLREQLQRHPWQQHGCVIKARLSDQLSIENYYRAQEAKGINATPKADDYVPLPVPER